MLGTLGLHTPDGAPLDDTDIALRKEMAMYATQTAAGKAKIYDLHDELQNLEKELNVG